MLRGIGQWTVTGGTGRFSNATGKGTIDGYGDFIKGVLNFQFKGTISAPNGGSANGLSHTSTGQQRRLASETRLSVLSPLSYESKRRRY